MQGYRQGIDIGIEQGDGSLKPDSVFSEGVRKAIEAKSLEHASLAVGTTKEQLGKVLQKAIDEGQGIAQVAKDIRDTFDFNSKTRSLRIARTELTGIINDGTTETLRREGFQQKEWSTVIDGRERPTHADADGQKVGIYEPFIVGGASGMYPGDTMLPVSETVNCRCAVVGAGFTDDRKRKLGDLFLRAHGALEGRFVVSLRRAFNDQRDRILSSL